MMKKRYILWVLLMWLAGISAAAQTTDDNDSTTTDFFVADTLSVDTLMLSWPQSVQVGIDRLLADEMFKTSQVAVMVYDLDADSAIYRFNERQLLRPASTMKILTAVAAIDRLGGSHRFKTELCYTGKIENATLTGNLYCVGGFDPRFNTDDMHAFIESLRKMGIDTIMPTKA